ncbi:efflux RND transporter periplasmic adaptor subunit [Acidisoma silvae]|uniref:Efflux RND transporter periplasmic adaptor subunit n=1 Tax=Acidisoma silvae TaxID=2802396 RepID=A0A964DZZ7_9PROT|nr:efflux RND transporter periplasmic adaptor subunit [Acidisoma silvae]MCB8876826.1 efflux RND transporter periplasmic adaptor subunit [Acidisoma silvae]
MSRLDEPETSGRRKRRSVSRSLLGLTTCLVILGGSGIVYFHGHSRADTPAAPPAAALPQVVASHPLEQDLDRRLGFLGQFSAVNRVELRAQVGGTLTGIDFKDGDIVQQGQLLFTIDPVPYEIKLSEAQAARETAVARLALAVRELYRAQALVKGSAGTVEDVDQRVADQRAAQAAVDDVDARIHDAQFDLDHCRITAPFTGRIGNHMVSIGNLIAGSRAATSPTTLLATVVSVDPIYLDFDMSESDYIAFSNYRAAQKGPLDDKVELALTGETQYSHQGVLDFVDNVLDRSSGTIHARATVPNADLSLTPGEFARLQVAVTQPAPTLLVPDASVLPDQSNYVVLTVSPDGTVVPKPVKPGDMRGGLRVIQSGLSPNDLVITDGLAYAAPGSHVRVQNGDIRFASAQQ